MEIDLSAVAPEDLPRVQALLEEVLEHKKFNSNLVEFLDMAYDWQKQAIEYTKEHRVVGITASNQTGKSQITCAMLACHACGFYPPWWKGAKYDRPVKIMVAGVDSNHNKNVLQEKLFGTDNWRLKSEIGTGMIPKKYIYEKSAVAERGDGLNAIKIKHKSGGYSQIIFKAYSQGREAAQGFQADIIMIDEQPHPDFWSEAILRTAATNGHIVCSFTPLKGTDNLVDKLLSVPAVADGATDQYGTKMRSDGNWAMIRATFDDITHISEKEKDSLKVSLPDYEVATRCYGVPMAGHGRIFPFTRQELVFNPNDIDIRDHWDHLVGIDIGHGFGRDPSAAVLTVYDEENDVVYVTAARKESTDTTRDLAKLIVKVEHQVPVAFPSDANRSSMNSEMTVSQQLRENDIKLLLKPFMNPKGADGKRNNHKMPGIKHISERIREGKLKISSKCSQLLDEMDQYSYMDNGKIQDGNDHCIDAFRYAVMSIIQGLGAPLRTDPWAEHDANQEDYTYNSY